MKMNNNKLNDIIKKVLLNINYDSKKTLSENKTIILESEQKKNKILFKNESNDICSKQAANSVLVDRKYLDDVFRHAWFDDEWFGPSEEETQILFFRRGTSKWSSCFCMNYPCDILKIYENYPGFVQGANKTQFKSLCEWKEFWPDQECFYIPELIPSLFSKTIKYLDKNYSHLPTSELNIGTKEKQKSKLEKQKSELEKQKETLEKEKEILKNNPNAHLLYPKDYAAIKGMKEWDLYKELFCCPETGKDSIKCNQNIALAIKNGWNTTKEPPKELTFCSNKNDINMSIDDDF